MSDFTVTNTSDKKTLTVTQRTLRGGALGDVVTLSPGEVAEVEIESAGVQLTVLEVPNPEENVSPTPVPEQ